VLGGGVEEDADVASRVGQVTIGPAEHRRGARGGGGEPGHDAHCGGLAGAVRAEEAGHLTGLDLEGDVVDGREGTVALGESVDCDHVVNPVRWAEPETSVISLIPTPTWV
jgi:hypothetical protein